jgi:hypothetical protein
MDKVISRESEFGTGKHHAEEIPPESWESN